MQKVPTDSYESSSTETASVDSTTDTASGSAIVMKDKNMEWKANINVYKNPSNITYTRNYYGIKQYHNLKKKFIFGKMLK